MSGFYDEVIAVASGREPSSLEATVRAVLWIGAHQALDMSTPPHATVSESVDLAKHGGAARASGLVNAVMRRITERTRDEWVEAVAPGSSITDLSIRTSHPEWIVAELQASLAARGRSGELEALLDSHNEAAAVTLAARPGLIDRDALASQSGGTPTEFSPYGVVIKAGSPGKVAAVRDGAAGVQDEGSQLVAAALASAAARPTSAHERWLDACAGPGGKTALLGALAATRGATLDALELHPHRAALVRDNVRSLPSRVVDVFVADATAWEGGPFDRILVDAPCTGLGALRRRPEARWRRSQEDLHDLTELQSRILAHTATLLTPGGVIAYVTCSPVLAETREIVAASGLQQLDARAALADVTGSAPEAWGSGPDVQLWTHAQGTDSMYLALLKNP
jgi:16S rRNA (cytosine967-C5)-methyltransferase